MAAYLTLGFVLIISLGAPRSLAQGLSDPTRPPREILGGGAGAAEPAANLSPAQIVIISTDRRQATINGRTVALGGRYGDATLVRISDEAAGGGARGAAAAPQGRNPEGPRRVGRASFRPRGQRRTRAAGVHVGRFRHPLQHGREPGGERKAVSEPEGRHGARGARGDP